MDGSRKFFQEWEKQAACLKAEEKKPEEREVDYLVKKRNIDREGSNTERRGNRGTGTECSGSLGFC